jgi:hypothetical protein
MPARANAFYSRLPQKDWLKAHVYHGTTNARVAQAKFFLEQLVEEVMTRKEKETEFYKRDMFLFGLANSLRSSLDSLTHQLCLFYGGTVRRKIDIQFSNLLRPDKIRISLPSPLFDHITAFQKSHERQKGDAFRYLTKLRNGSQHRNITLLQTRTVVPMSLNIMGPGSNGGGADWTGGSPNLQSPVQAEPIGSSLIEPDLRLPDDPEVEPGEETFDRGRPLLGTLRYLYAETREFILSAYDLAV